MSRFKYCCHKREISSDVKQTQLVCYITVLGQAWPNTTNTQGKQSQLVCYITVLGQAWSNNTNTQGKYCCYMREISSEVKQTQLVCFIYLF